MLSVPAKTKNRNFQFPPRFEEHFQNLCFQNALRPHKNDKPVISNSSGLERVFEKLRLRDGSISVNGKPNSRNKAAFSNFSGVV